MCPLLLLLDPSAPYGCSNRRFSALDAARRRVWAGAGTGLRRCLAALRPGLLTLLLSAATAAQTLTDGAARVTAAGGREVVALSASPAVAQTQVAGIVAQTQETATQRIHVVSYEGETYRAATPLDGPFSRIVFDPARRTFVPLLPSIRVELSGGVRIEDVAAQVGATGVTIFESLGFAIVELPQDVHPADAVARVTSAFGGGVATVRLRGPRREWR